MVRTIAHEHEACSASFRGLCEAIEGNHGRRSYQSLLPSVHDSYGRFNVWSGNIGAHQKGWASLDYRLRDASHVKDQVFKLLEYLHDTLDETISIVNGFLGHAEESFTIPSYPESDSSDEEVLPDEFAAGIGLLVPTDPEAELEQSLHGIDKILTNLFKVLAMIRKGHVSHDRLLKSTNIDVSHYLPYDVQHVRTKFPAATQYLVDRMSKAISRRRQYLNYQEQHHEPPARPFTNPHYPKLNLQTQHGPHSSDLAASSKALTTQQSAMIELGAKSPTSFIQSTNVSTFAASAFPNPVNHDVDVYSSAGTRSSHASIERLPIPPPPESSRDGHDFECQLCYTICRLKGLGKAQREWEWKTHVYKDLQPYMCTFEFCYKTDTTFGESSEWIKHELQVHRREWCCNEAQHKAYQNKGEFLEHMKNTHRNLYGEANLESVVSLFERPSSTVNAPCPFCLCDKTREFSVGRFEKHVARHMEALALFALPRAKHRDASLSAASGLRAEVSYIGDSTPQHSPHDRNSDEGVSNEPVNYTTNITSSSDVSTQCVIDNLIREFCLAETSTNTNIPKDCFASLSSQVPKQHRLPDTMSRDSQLEMLRQSIDQQANKGLEYIELLSVLRSLLIPFSRPLTNLRDSEVAERFENLAFKVAVLSQCVASSDTVEKGFKDRMQTLVADIYAQIDLRSQLPMIDPSWDYIQPRVPIAESTLKLLSYATTAAQALWSARDSEQMVFKELGDLFNHIQSTLSGSELKRDVARQIERKVWSLEEIIGKLKIENLDSIERSTRSRLIETVYDIFSLLERETLQQQETVVETSTRVETGDTKPKAIPLWIHQFGAHQLASHQVALAAWQPGTLTWFLGSQEYQRWKQHETPQLWLLGNPACGKTLLCSAIIEELKIENQDSADVGLAYFYCESSKHDPTRPPDILGSLFAQFSVQSRSMAETWRPLSSQALSHDIEPPNESLKMVLISILESFRTSYIVIDGIDRRTNIQISGFLEALSGLNTKVSILMSQRHIDHLISRKESRNGSIFTFKERHVSQDIEVVLRTRLRRYDLYPIPGELQDEVTVKLLRSSHGMFTYPTSTLQMIQHCRDPAEVRRILSGAPHDIVSSWKDSLINIHGQGEQAATSLMAMLEILCVAARSLTLDELRQMYAHQVEDELASNVINASISLDDVLAISSDLVALSCLTAKGVETPVVDLVHPDLRVCLLQGSLSTTEEIEIFSIQEAQANLRVAFPCLQRLLDFKDNNGADEIGACTPDTLLQYAARYWFSHVGDSSNQGLYSLIFRLFASPSQFGAWLSLWDPDVEAGTRTETQHPSPLYYACLLGLFNLTEGLLARGATLDQTGGKHKFPLLAAIESGNCDIVDLLLQHNDDANKDSEAGDPAIIRAAIKGNVDMVELLLSHQAFANARDKQHLTALHWAVRKRHEKVVATLLLRGADVNARDIDHRTALYYTLDSSGQTTRLFDLLVQYEIDIREPDRFGDTMLYHATRSSDIEGMRRLVDAGSQADQPNSNNVTTLHVAASCRFVEGVSYLLETCFADPNVQDGEGRTALHHVFLEETKDLQVDSNEDMRHKDMRRAEIVRCLLGTPADWSIKDQKGLTPLGLAKARACPSPFASHELEVVETYRESGPEALTLKAGSQKHSILLPPYYYFQGPFKVGMLRRLAAKATRTGQTPSSSTRVSVFSTTLSPVRMRAPKSNNNLSTIPIYLSFIFRIEALRPDYQNQGRRMTPTGAWVPPTVLTAYNTITDTFWRWRGGRVTSISSSDATLRAGLGRFDVVSLFSQDPDTPQLLVVPFDARTRDVQGYSRGWLPLTFSHKSIGNTGGVGEYYSSVSDNGDESHIAGPGQGFWMPQLLPSWYNYCASPDAAPRTHKGLIGNLAILLALAAFSAPAANLTEAMASIRPGSWAPHRHQCPSELTPGERGMIVTIYLDPINPAHSTRELLKRLEEGDFGPFYGHKPAPAGSSKPFAPSKGMESVAESSKGKASQIKK